MTVYIPAAETASRPAWYIYLLAAALLLSGIAEAATPTPPFLYSAGLAKADFGHYAVLRAIDTPATATALCGTPNLRGLIKRLPWAVVETSKNVYTFAGFDAVLAAMPSKCRLWLFIEFKSFDATNPCPGYLKAYAAPNAGGGTTCFMWEPVVRAAYGNMLAAAAKRYDGNPQVEGVVLQESALSLNGPYSQDTADGGTYTPERWRDGLIDLVQKCTLAFRKSRCMAFLNFLRGNNGYLQDVADAMATLPNQQACVSGPDILPGDPTLTTAYAVLRTYRGCRANSAQNDSYAVAGCDLNCVLSYALGSLCVNSYVFWNHYVGTGLNWNDAVQVIAKRPFDAAWHACAS